MPDLEETLARLLKRRLPPYKVPDEIFLCEDLPKNESGKIMKQALKREPPVGVR